MPVSLLSRGNGTLSFKRNSIIFIGLLYIVGWIFNNNILWKYSISGEQYDDVEWFAWVLYMNI